MSTSYGKKFEIKFKEDFCKLKNSFLLRLPDQVSGWKGSNNICDFIGYINPHIFLLEVKTITGNTFPLANFSQLSKLQQFKDIPGLRRGVVIWYTQRDAVIYVPVTTIEKMIADGKKSVNIRTIESEGYNYVKIPSVKKRVFLDSDYSVLCNLPEEW